MKISLLPKPNWLPPVMLAICTLVMPSLSCSSDESPEANGEMTLTVSSPAFSEGGEIPAKYTCDGQDVSPELTWSQLPAGTKSLVLIMDDPDAPGGVFTHWLLFNIPGTSQGLAEAIPAGGELSDGSSQGKNDFNTIGYGGPCPPSGSSHHYHFTLYALDQYLDLNAGVAKKQLTAAMQQHILAQGRLSGTYHCQ